MIAKRVLLCLVLLAGAGRLIAAEATSCTRCHGDLEWVQKQDWVQMVQDFQEDVHHSIGLSCHDCHGGNPDPKLAEDPTGAMDPDFKPNPYRGALTRKDIPQFCGRCHADPEYMKRFKPDARVDQLKEYLTSQHGKLLQTGDTNVAVCIDCHGTHQIRRPADPQSSVYPTAVAKTCRACHSDPKRMGQYKLEDGRPLPIDQYQRWSRSVHATALLEKGDLSAPTCNDCHGNHGAVPPQLASITFVCGQCHGREASLFRASPKSAGFKDHNETYLPEMGPGGCAECHEPPHPSAALKNIRSLTECITCHGNHAVVSPTITMVGPIPEIPCAYCHEGTTPAAHEVAEPETLARRYQSVKAQLLAQARQNGLQGDDLFDWMVQQALHLPYHRQSETGKDGEAALRPEFERLFHRLRIGPTHFTYTDPVSGEPVHEKLIRCTDCHSPDSDGYQVSSQITASLHNLAALSARAERILLAAKRGGVEVRKIQLQLDKAVDAQIELQALVHSFSCDKDSPFVKKHADGLAVAEAALTSGHAALNDLRFRRKGLFVFLGISLLVLVALGLKIRDVSRRGADRPEE